MSKRGENIRKRKDGRWEARFRNGLNKYGVPNYTSVYGKTYKEAKEKKQIFLNTQKIKTEKSSLSFGDVQRLWADQNCVHLKASTERKYNYLLQRHILPDLGSLRITQVSAPLINTFLAQKMKTGRLDGEGGLSAAYVRSIMLIINSIMLFAVSEKYCSPLCSRINKPPVAQTEIPVLSSQQCNKLEAAISMNPSSTEIGILIALYTGLRLGEICALSWDDINLESRLLTVRHTVSRINGDGTTKKSLTVITSPKTPASLRVIPICSKLESLLRTYKENATSQYVVSTTDTFVSPRTFEYRFHSFLKKHNIQDIHFHALRHTFATQCIERSMDVKSLSEILGHASESITLKTYVHSSLALKRMQLEKLTYPS